MNIRCKLIMSVYLFSCLYFFVDAAKAASEYKPCIQDIKKQAARSEELQKLLADDQKARINNSPTPDIQDLDSIRRKRVGEIFGEGCFKTADDFYAAALIFQHGGDLSFDKNTGLPEASFPDHIFQAFLWAKRAHDLGNTKAKWLIAATADRYLWYIGYKQIFGTQGGRNSPSDRCWCLVPVEDKFLDETRIVYTGKSLKEAILHVQQFPGHAPECKPSICSFTLKSPPPGILPGIW